MNNPFVPQSNDAAEQQGRWYVRAQNASQTTPARMRYLATATASSNFTDNNLLTPSPLIVTP